MSEFDVLITLDNTPARQLRMIAPHLTAQDLRTVARALEKVIDRW